MCILLFRREFRLRDVGPGNKQPSFDVHSQDKRIIVSFIPLPIENWLFPIIGCFQAPGVERADVKMFTSHGMCGEIFGAECEAARWFGFHFYFGSSIFCSHLLWGSLFAVTPSCFHLAVEQQRQRGNKSEQQHLLVTSCIIPGHRQACETIDYCRVCECGQDKTSRTHRAGKVLSAFDCWICYICIKRCMNLYEILQTDSRKLWI